MGYDNDLIESMVRNDDLHLWLILTMTNPSTSELLTSYLVETLLTSTLDWHDIFCWPRTDAKLRAIEHALSKVKPNSISSLYRRRWPQITVTHGPVWHPTDMSPTHMAVPSLRGYVPLHHEFTHWPLTSQFHSADYDTIRDQPSSHSVYPRRQFEMFGLEQGTHAFTVETTLFYSPRVVTNCDLTVGRERDRLWTRSYTLSSML